MLSRILTTVYKIGLAMFILVICFLFWFIHYGPEQIYSPDPYCDTVFTKDFTFKKFKKIIPGMDSLEVIHLIGQPHTKTTYCSEKFYQLNFNYSHDGKLLQNMKPGDRTHEDYAWHNVTVSFNREGKVENANCVWCYD